MSMLRGQFAKTLAPGYRKVIFETYKERPTEGDKLVNMNTATRAYLEDFPVAGFGSLVEKPEGGPITLQDALEGTAKRYTWTTYGLGFRVTKEMVEDELYGVFGNKMSKALGRSVRNNFELVAHSIFNNAFNTSYSGFVSGEALCQAGHTIIRGTTTVSNFAAADFSLLALQAGLEHFHGLVDEAGLPMVRMPKTLVHNIGDYWAVNQVLKSPNLPGGNNNDINQVNREGITPHLSHYLSDADAWFLLADETDLNYFDRRKPTFENGDDLLTGDAYFLVSRRNGAGWGDWRGVYGSQGA